ncbi:serine/threonine-protein kinase [Leifsonia sp. YAF41]|uniref:serine/threonine-protein kinase n=1 Tax=Leifsonia sp. YAF41 TaxID=3233086 RepID=UPI003F97DC7F
MASRLPSAPPVISGYTYIRPLGTGGFADVFLFEQDLPRRSVAVKVLLHDIVDSDVLRMFNAEADVMARLSSHPSILTVYNASISADGRPYLVMEYCPSSLSGRFRREVLPVAEVLNVAVKIACALETAHRTGVLHRDIKPSNILTTSFGTPVLADFGIATSLAATQQEQLFAMSVPWSAPEVVREETTGTVQTEVWALGATIYSLLAGRSPFETTDGQRSSRQQLRQRIVRAGYTPIGRADVSVELERVLARSMSKDPAMRQASLLEFAMELQRVQGEMGIQPTVLDIAADDWAAAGTLVDFNNASLRGPVRSEVVVPSKRMRRGRSTPVARSLTDEEALPDKAERPQRGSGLRVALLLSGGLIVGAGAAVGVLVLAGVI